MLKIIGLTKEYIQKGKKITVLKDINISLPDTGLVFILGKSGSGKTTLLNLLGGLDNPTKGEIYLDNFSLTKCSSEQLENYRNNNIGFIFQDFNLLNTLNVYENVSLSLQLQNRENQVEVLEVLKKLNIEDLKLRKINELSGGEKARVGISRALVKNPSILLADEPTGALDKETSEKIFAILKEISKEKLVIVVSHDENLASIYGDCCYYLENKTISTVKLTSKLTKFTSSQIKIIHKLSLKNLLKISNLLFRKNKWKYFIIQVILILNFSIFLILCLLPQININKTHAEALVNNKKNNIYIYKQIDNYTSNANISSFNNEELKTITDDLKQNDYQYIINTSFYSNDVPIFFNYVDIYKNDLPEIFSLLYSNFSEDKLEFILTDEQILKDYQYIGTFPKEKNEIMISNVLAYFIENHGIYDNLGNPYFPKSNEEFINDKIPISFNGNNFIVTGIYDLKDFDLEEFSKKKIEYQQGNLGQEVVYDELTSRINNEFGNIFVNDNFFQVSNLIPNNEIDKTIYKEYIKVDDEYIYLDYNNIANRYLTYNLNDFEIIINQDILDILSKQDFSKSFQNITDLTMQEYADKYIIENNILNKTITLCIRDTYNYHNEEEFVYYNLKIVGILVDENEYNHKYYISNNIMNEYVLSNNLNKRITIYENNPTRIETLLEKYPIDSNIYRTRTPYTNIIKENMPITLEIKNNSIFYILLSGSLILVLFTLCMYFIYHFIKKDIGILKCLGTKSKDIKKAIMITDISMLILSLLISIPLSIAGVNLVNYIISLNLGFTIHYLYFNSKIIVYLIALIILAIILTIIFPLHKIMKLNPIEVLRKE